MVISGYSFKSIYSIILVVKIIKFRLVEYTGTKPPLSACRNVAFVMSWEIPTIMRIMFSRHTPSSFHTRIDAYIRLEEIGYQVMVNWWKREKHGKLGVNSVKFSRKVRYAEKIQFNDQIDTQTPPIFDTRPQYRFTGPIPNARDLYPGKTSNARTAVY